MSEVDFRCRRLGNAEEGSVRPIIVTFPSAHEAQRLLRLGRRLNNNVDLAPDRTKAQREKYGKLRQEVLDHNNNNPTSKKTIRYIRDKPVVVDGVPGSESKGRIIFWSFTKTWSISAIRWSR